MISINLRLLFWANCNILSFCFFSLATRLQLTIYSIPVSMTEALVPSTFWHKFFYKYYVRVSHIWANVFSWGRYIWQPWKTLRWLWVGFLNQFSENYINFRRFYLNKVFQTSKKSHWIRQQSPKILSTIAVDGFPTFWLQNNWESTQKFRINVEDIEVFRLQFKPKIGCKTNSAVDYTQAYQFHSVALTYWSVSYL